MKNKNDSLISIFISFAKIGVLTIGGGYAMLPMLELECVTKHKWVTKEEMLNMYAIGQCTPGIIAINTATYIGFKKRGVLGGIFATLGMVFPSFVIIIAIASILQQFCSNPYVLKAFKGIRIAVCALIAGSAIRLSRSVIKDFEKFLIAFLALLLQIFLGLSPVVLVCLLIVYSIVIFVSKKEGKK